MPEKDLASAKGGSSVFDDSVTLFEFYLDQAEKSFKSSLDKPVTTYGSGDSLRVAFNSLSQLPYATVTLISAYYQCTAELSDKNKSYLFQQLPPHVGDIINTGSIIESIETIPSDSVCVSDANDDLRVPKVVVTKKKLIELNQALLAGMLNTFFDGVCQLEFPTFKSIMEGLSSKLALQEESDGKFEMSQEMREAFHGSMQAWISGDSRYIETDSVPHEVLADISRYYEIAKVIASAKGVSLTFRDFLNVLPRSSLPFLRDGKKDLENRLPGWRIGAIVSGVVLAGVAIPTLVMAGLCLFDSMKSLSWDVIGMSIATVVAVVVCIVCLLRMRATGLKRSISAPLAKQLKSARRGLLEFKRPSPRRAAQEKQSMTSLASSRTVRVT